MEKQLFEIIFFGAFLLFLLQISNQQNNSRYFDNHTDLFFEKKKNYSSYKGLCVLFLHENTKSTLEMLYKMCLIFVLRIPLPIKNG
jgi:hypothetical protein